MKRSIILFVSVLALTSCNCYRQLERIEKKCPHILVDTTITVRDTFFITGINYYDTFFVLMPDDTIYLDTGEVHINLIRFDNNLFKAGISTDSDTAFIEKKIMVPKLIKTQVLKKGFFYYLGVFSLIIIVVVFFISIIFRFLRL
jgi:hypothetical protein